MLNISGFIRFAIAIAITAAFCSCSASKSLAQDFSDATLTATLERIIQSQAADWNRGDIEGFMRAYWNSDQLTFSAAGQVQRGWNTTRERYLQRYPTPAAMGRVSFTGIEVQTLGSQSALMLGRWHLQRTDPIGGNFTLVWRQIDGNWLIVHDHTSTDEKSPELKK